MMKNALESMTGFAVIKANICGADMVCKIRSLNHRFLDLKVRLPRSEQYSLDSSIRKIVSSNFKRGAIEISISFDADTGNQRAPQRRLNSEVIKEYWNELQTLSVSLGATPLQSLEQIVRLPESLTNSQDVFDWNDLAQKEINTLLVVPAINELKSARCREGAEVKTHILSMLSDIEKEFANIKELEPSEKEKAISTFIERTQKTVDQLGAHWLLKDEKAVVSLSQEFEARLREEASVWIEKRDYTEELSRFSNHLLRFREMLDHSKESVGRQLEFLHQESLREINTLGNKAQSTDVSKHVVEIKALLERIREQLANVE